MMLNASIKSFLAFSLALIISAQVYGQSTPASRPDLPGSLMVDVGTSILINGLSNMNPHWFKSKSINVTYFYDKQLGSSHFSVHPGIQIGIDRLGFKKSFTLKDSLGEVLLVNINNIPKYQGGSLSKTKFSMTYLNVPVELRYNSNKTDISKGFMLGIGANVGVLLEAHTKIKYEDGNDKFVDKYKGNFQLEKIRYGLQARVGIDWLSVVYYYGLSEMFQSNKGPSDTNATLHKVAFSFNLF